MLVPLQSFMLFFMLILKCYPCITEVQENTISGIICSIDQSCHTSLNPCE
ncbi:hypothetical protein KC19_3G023000 [Ceratodon purpureus]|uniref:Uncharacterized protein n=1 Tax=Ceratodon purpureus TaxID=3225 RepID=A0A8T0IG15_CERPU|nr:hypothetical protein KC19_3G023000 [Ceratodon purpureus]